MALGSPDRTRALRGYVWFSIIGGLITLALHIVDARTLAGEGVWLKPLKFFVSSAIFAATIGWGLARVEGRDRLVRLLGRIMAWGLTFEMVVICTQAARGVKSHFNQATALDGLAFTLMGIVISLVVISSLVGAVLIARGRFNGSRSLKQAYLWGYVIFFAAAFSAAAMVRPAPELAPGTTGSHFVGSVEGEARTLPLTGWNAEGGDLRVAHFFGMHVIHALLALVLLMKRRGVVLDSPRAVGSLRALAALGAVVTVALFIQAIRGVSVLATEGHWLALGGAAFTAIVYVALGSKPAAPKLAKAA